MLSPALHAAHVHIAPGKLNWAPTVVREQRPPEAFTATSPVAVLASLNDFAFNFGHALFDFLFPVFNMLQLLGLYHPSFQLLLGTHQVQMMWLKSRPLSVCKLCQHASGSLIHPSLNLLMDQHAPHTRMVSCALSGWSAVCYKPSHAGRLAIARITPIVSTPGKGS